MRIAFIVTEFPLLSETFILNQITGLLDRGHQVDIYADKRGNINNVHPAVEKYNLLAKTYYLPDIPDNLFYRFIKGLRLGLKLSFQNPQLTLQALNVFKYGNQAISLWLLYTAIPNLDKVYDIIHCQFGHLAFRGMAFRQMNAPSAKLITIFRGYDISTFVKRKGLNIYDELFKQGDFFLANCEFFREKAINLGCHENLIRVHFSGLDCQRFIFKPRYPSPDGIIRIATTGRLVEKKGIEYSIRAIAQQAKINPNLEYNLIGDGELKEELQNLIHNLGIENIVNLLGWKNEREIVEILDKSHLFIAPSVTAKDGNQDAPINVLKEAMAMGLPVISTYHGGIPELVENGVSGFLVPERDVEALAEKLNYLIQNPQQWCEMGKAGRAYVEKYYDLDMLNDKLVQVYQQILNSNLANRDLKSDLVTLSN
ncbi:glycosyltransferase [Oscillatoria salina]|uniref:glycosyltransferase n=1 Tax=Oscillatoria salina TaxID=331517 RepID=UPI0013B962BD|nr:glycosyltransferase [Oscillatoria salina]MBZ8180605.1 colanic acid biosynthesis glycosyltransferase WcaL [Oscillatoria salina IIICB1]NET88452.1 colanic acid biosynthesis glycosyltransferase WcaL [Kamptonema sp. SIO1D9]